MQDSHRENVALALIMLGSIAFYLPFLSFQFIGDDWLWLYNAKKALHEPSIFLERPMYGYFRPLNMLAVFVMLHIFGPNATVFSLFSILLHAINVFLLWKVLKSHGASPEIRLTAAAIFAFYYLNSAAIEWISVGHDLWVTGLILIYLLLLKKFQELPTFSRFSLVFAVGWAAALFKESGLVAIVIYFLYLILHSSNPLDKKYRNYSLVYFATYFMFLGVYFLTRSYADKQIELGLNTIVNTLYFIGYLILPLAQRVADRFSPGQLEFINWIRIILVFVLPVALAYVFARASIIFRVFVVWILLFIGTVAVFKWDLSLSTPFPKDPASRFMYSPFAGMAVCLSFLFWAVLSFFKRQRVRIGLATTALAIYAITNFAVVKATSPTFENQQRLSQSIIDSIENNIVAFTDIDTVVVLTGDIATTEQIIASGKHMPAILAVKFGLSPTVRVTQHNGDFGSLLEKKNRTLIIGWDIRKNRLHIPQSQSLL